jgi:hypothetical protein
VIAEMDSQQKKFANDFLLALEEQDKEMLGNLSNELKGRMAKLETKVRLQTEQRVKQQFGEAMSGLMSGLRTATTDLTEMRDHNQHQLDAIKASMGIPSPVKAEMPASLRQGFSASAEDVASAIEDLALPVEQAGALGAMTTDEQATFLAANAEEQQSTLGFALTPTDAAIARAKLVPSAAQTLPSAVLASSPFAAGNAGSGFSASLPALSNGSNGSPPGSAATSDEQLSDMLSGMALSPTQQQAMHDLSPKSKKRFVGASPEQQQNEFGFSLPRAAAGGGDSAAGGAAGPLSPSARQTASIPKEALLGVGAKSGRKGSVSFGQFVRRCSVEYNAASDVAMAAQAFAGGIQRPADAAGSEQGVSMEGLAKERMKNKFISKIRRKSESAPSAETAGSEGVGESVA